LCFSAIMSMKQYQRSRGPFRHCNEQQLQRDERSECVKTENLSGPPARLVTLSCLRSRYCQRSPQLIEARTPTHAR
jgi:hypothetical protein